STSNNRSLVGCGNTRPATQIPGCPRSGVLPRRTSTIAGLRSRADLHTGEVHMSVPTERALSAPAPTARRDAAITAVGLVKNYGERPALDGLTFSVEPGTVFGLLGPNGAGKSTTIKILTTLSRPDAGSASVAGLDVLRRPDPVRRAIGVVTQKASMDPT